VQIRVDDGAALVTVALPVLNMGLAWLEVIQHAHGQVFVTERVPLLVTDISEVAEELQLHLAAKTQQLDMNRTVNLLKMLSSILHPPSNSDIPPISACARTALAAISQGWDNTLEEVIDSVRSHNAYSCADLLQAIDATTDLGILIAAILSRKPGTVAMVMTFMDEVAMPLRVTELRGMEQMSALHWAASCGVQPIVNLLLANADNAVLDAWTGLLGGPYRETPEHMLARVTGAPGTNVRPEPQLSAWDVTVGSGFNEPGGDEHRSYLPRGLLDDDPGGGPNSRHGAVCGPDWTVAPMVGASELCAVAHFAATYSMDRLYLGTTFALWLLPRGIATPLFLAASGFHCLAHVFAAEYQALGAKLHLTVAGAGLRLTGCFELLDTEGRQVSEADLSNDAMKGGSNVAFAAYTFLPSMVVSLSAAGMLLVSPDDQSQYPSPQVLAVWPLACAAVAAALALARLLLSRMGSVAGVYATHAAANFFVHAFLAAHMAGVGPWMPVANETPPTSQLSAAGCQVVLDVALALPQTRFSSVPPRLALPARAAHVVAVHVGIAMLAAAGRASLPHWPCMLAVSGFSTAAYMWAVLDQASAALLNTLRNPEPAAADTDTATLPADDDDGAAELGGSFSGQTSHGGS